MPKLSLEERGAIIALRSEQMSFEKIAKRLGCSKTAARLCYKKFTVTGSVKNRQRCGRPRKTDQRLDARIRRYSEVDRKLTAVDIHGQIPDANVSVRTVQRRLNDAGLFGRSPRKKPFLSKRHLICRLAWAKQRLNWQSADWSKIIWSDECKFNRIASDGRTYVRRRSHEEYDSRCTKATMKHGGGSVTVWGCFSQSGPGPIRRIQGIMNADMYCNVLEEALEKYADENMPLDWIYQQDNDPKHKSKRATQWFQDHNIRLLDWPAQSPDLSPIENLWDYVNREVKKQKPGSVDELWNSIQKVWAEIPKDLCAKLVGTMPKRCREVVDRKGAASHY